MRVSEHFGLDIGQGGLDFVDVDVEGDVPVYIDPVAIGVGTGEWLESCQGLIQSFFEEMLNAIKHRDEARVRSLIAPLMEPNETHLGVSHGRARGRGLGKGVRGEQLIRSLTTSRAGASGLLTDLSDVALFVPRVGRDITSDIITNIIRGPLIYYTQAMCALYGIPMEPQDSGLIWDSEKGYWDDTHLPLPRAGGNKLILVPKSIVRVKPITNGGKYYRGYLRPYYEDEELGKPGMSPLVKVLKDGRREVKLGRLDDLLGTTKPDHARNTERFPEAIRAYREHIRTPGVNPPVAPPIMDALVGSDPVDFQDLIGAVKAVAPGRHGATSYHRAVAELLSAIFNGSLGNMVSERPIHDGRKRLDIQYDNVAEGGFFRWLSLHYAAGTIPVECKNYTSDPANPELDQLTGRFGRSRTQVGILVCRTVNDRVAMDARCRDAAKDGRGYMLVLDDSDLQRLVDGIEADDSLADGGIHIAFPLLREKFDKLIN